MNIELRDVPPLRLAVASCDCRHDGIGEAIQRSLPSVVQAVLAAGAKPGTVACRYIDWRESDCTMEVGIAVDDSFAGADGVEVRELPAHRVAFGAYYGPYDGLAAASNRMMAWIREHGLSIAGPPREHYVTDPGSEPDPSAWLTELQWPVSAGT